MLIFPFFSDNKNIKNYALSHKVLLWLYNISQYKVLHNNNNKKCKKTKKTDFSFISLTILTCLVIFLLLNNINKNDLSKCDFLL